MGWNALALTEAGSAHPVLDGLAGGDHVYFVHGYHMALADPAQLLATVDYAGPLTEAVLLGNIAVRYRESKLEWDAEAMRITNHEKANSWLRREYRDGWDITAS